MYIFLDIETVANDHARQFFERYWEPPGNVSRPETIEAKRKEQLETLNGAGLKWWTGRVACICAESDDGQKFEETNIDEAGLLRSFFSWCLSREAEGHNTYLGKNGVDFDLPFLIGRAMACRVNLPWNLAGGGEKYPLRDIDRIFGWGRSAGQVGKLDYYAWGLGIEPKTSHGAEVQGMWNHHQYEDIKSYCANDVRIIKEIFHRWRSITE